MTKQLTKGNFIGRTVLAVCLFLILILCLAGCAEETNPYIGSLDIQMTLNTDGSANIVETHVVNFSNRGDEWWNYYKTITLNDTSSGNYGNTLSKLSELKVTVDGVNFPYDESKNVNLDNASQHTVESMRNTAYTYNQFSSSNTEIGVVMSGFRSGTKTVQFSYKLSNVMIGYADCAGLYYKFVDESNTLYIEKLTAKVNFASVNISEIAVWTHIEDGNGQGIIQESDTPSEVNYLAEQLNAGVYFETRLLLPQEGYSTEKKNAESKKMIGAQETQWQQDFLKKAKRAQNVKIADIVMFCLIIAGTVPLCIFIRKKRKPKKLPNAPEYIREIPTGWSAGEMAPLYHYYGKYNVSDGISATILDLCRRHYIDIKVGDKKKQAEIIVNNLDISGLAPHEKVVFELLKKTGDGKPFTMKYMEKYASDHYSYYSQKIEEYKRAADGMGRGMNLYPKHGKDRIASLFSAIAGGVLFLGVLVLLNTFILGIGELYLILTGLALLGMGIVVETVIKKQQSPLPVNGQEVYDKFHALGRFMQEFSNMDKHELPQLILWEEYMVYATAMGIADEVAKQLEIAYPEYRAMVANGVSPNMNTFLILYLLSPGVRIASNFALAATIGSISRNVVTMRRNAKIASNVKKFSGGGGFGGGGGFSGGGGGFGGGGMGAR